MSKRLGAVFAVAVSGALAGIVALSSPASAATKGTLRIGYTTAAVTTLDPAKIATQIGGNFASLAMQTLVQLDGKGRPQPLLATGWSVSKNHLTWTFTLRKGVKFQDGAALNADAVKYSLERSLDPATASPLSSTLTDIASVKANGLYSVSIQTKHPYAPLLAALSYVPADIVSPKAATAAGLQGFGSAPVGTGPYSVKSFNPNGSISFVRNPSYWGKKPSLEGIDVTFYQDESTLVSSLMAGSTDLAWSLSSAQVPVLRSNSSVKLLAHSGYTISYLGFNTKKAPFDRAVVRQAVAHAVDMKAILRDVIGGGGIGTAGPMGPTVFGFDPKLTAYAHDPALAQKILNQAGISNLKIDLYIPIDATRARVAALMQQQLKQAGISLNIVQEPFGTFLADVSAGKEDMFALQWSNGTGDADFTFNSFASGSSANYTKLSNATLDKLIDQQKTQFDQAARLKTIQSAQLVIKQLSPWIPVFTVNYLAGARKAVTGVKLVPSGNFDQMLAQVKVSG
jgi:peptide/nickel transport system substrate-binding protein